MNISVKFFLNDDIRRISVPKDDITWGNLTELVRSVYKGRSDEQWDNTRICYVDDEGDRCTVTSEAELQEAVSLCQSCILRLILLEPKQPQPQEQRDSDSHFVRDRKNRCERKPDWKGFGHRKVILESEGLALMDASRFSEAKEKFEEQLSLFRNPWRKSKPLYHIACCEARLGNISSSLDFLRRSTKCGFTNADRITNDPNFQDMKEVPQFQELVSEIGSNPRWNRRFQEQTPSPLAEKHGQRILLKKQARELLNSGDQEEIKKARDLFHQMAALTVKEWHKRIPFYNIARCEALLGNVEEAMKFLKEAIDLGFKNLRRMENDSEFASFQDLDEFKSLVESVRLLKASKQGRKNFRCRYRLGETQQGSTTSSEGNLQS